jgi:hypothetical protein
MIGPCYNPVEARMCSSTLRPCEASTTRAPSRRDEPMLARLGSGGQTGVDRAALDAALELGIVCGGSALGNPAVPQRPPLRPPAWPAAPRLGARPPPPVPFGLRLLARQRRAELTDSFTTCPARHRPPSTLASAAPRPEGAPEARRRCSQLLPGHRRGRPGGQDRGGRRGASGSRRPFESAGG